jgi:formylglycine-generating enzyme required for sulfatase activity
MTDRWTTTGRYVHNAMLLVCVMVCGGAAGAQTGWPLYRIPDTGQTTDYTTTAGEDADYTINAPSYTIVNAGTIIDNVTGLMWQRMDGGEMTIERAATFCDTLTLGGYTDWRLPTAREVFGILHHNRLNPAIDTTIFTVTTAEYWWTSESRAGDVTRVWSANAGGGIGAHPRSETLSAGGTKRFHVRAVRNVVLPVPLAVRLQDNGDGTVSDRTTGLVWQKMQPATTMSWESALVYAETLSLAGRSDWRLPNVKELQSLNDPSITKPSIRAPITLTATTGKLWSSTTQFNAVSRAWYMEYEFGIVTYDLKTLTSGVLCVRGNSTGQSMSVREVLIPAGQFDMGDHHGFVDPSHPSDELPLHTVNVDSFFMGATEMTNATSVELLNQAYADGMIEVRGNCVFLKGGADTLLYLNVFASYSSIGWNGSVFAVVDLRAQHPIVGIQWSGAAMLCNRLSIQNGLAACYDLSAWSCDMSRNGYRLPTEAEWEWAARGGHTAPYYNYPWGDDQDVTKANWPGSGDPYETGTYPLTTPVAFYDGTLKLKSSFNWPGSATSYQTTNGANSFGLFDMAGNVWEFVNDWYDNSYYSASPHDNPTGPVSGFIMPDGKPYRGMRGGNWYNGYSTTAVNDGHSRVSNRNPSYYRGPQDPSHPWYHVGFRVVRRPGGTTTGIGPVESVRPDGPVLNMNYPNPFNPSTTIGFSLPRAGAVRLEVFSCLGQRVATIIDGPMSAGLHSVVFHGDGLGSGVYFARLQTGDGACVRRMMLLR